MGVRVEEGLKVKFYSPPASELEVAQARWDRLTGSVYVAEFGRGGASIPDDETGTGLRAAKYRTEAGCRFFEGGFTGSDKRRLGSYRRLIDGMMDGIISETDASNILSKIWRRNREELEIGGFLFSDISRRIREMVEHEMSDSGVGPTIWEAQVDYLSGSV